MVLIFEMLNMFRSTDWAWSSKSEPSTVCESAGCSGIGMRESSFGFSILSMDSGWIGGGPQLAYYLTSLRSFVILVLLSLIIGLLCNLLSIVANAPKLVFKL